MYLRIALETHQKECLVGGFDRTFSVGPVFRNEGITQATCRNLRCVSTTAYWDYQDNMRFTEHMLSTLLMKTCGKTTAKIPNREGKLIEVDFGGKWPVLSLHEVIKRDCVIDFLEACPTAEALRKAIKDKKIELEVDINVLGRGNLIDSCTRKSAAPRSRAPHSSPSTRSTSSLARRNDENPAITDRFQLVVGGWEIVNAYSELVDPV